MTRPAIPDAHTVLACLAGSLALLGPAWAGIPLEPLPDEGLAHWHVRLCGTGLLARIPKQSQLGLPAQQNLDYQAACFARAAACGHTPALHAVLPPGMGLARGALLVQEVLGRPAQLPDDMPALMQALAALHRLPLPEPALRAPLWSPPDPLPALQREIATQAEFLPAAGLSPVALRGIGDVLAQWQADVQRSSRPAVSLIAFDAHPGNFLVDATGRAWLVDLEKCRYSHAPLDLAHATLYTSTTWTAGAAHALALADLVDAYAAWSAAAGAGLAQASLPWFLPLRRAMWLWSVTWCAKWRAASGQAACQGGDGEDWSTQRSAEALVDHVRERVAHYLEAAIVERMQDEFASLAKVWT